MVECPYTQSWSEYCDQWEIDNDLDLFNLKEEYYEFNV